MSIKGPIIATIPSLTGSSVFAAAWAIEADPTPPSLLKTALLIPSTKTPKKPPYIASGVKAWENILVTTPGYCVILVKIMYKDAVT